MKRLVRVVCLVHHADVIHTRIHRKCLVDNTVHRSNANIDDNMQTRTNDTLTTKCIDVITLDEHTAHLSLCSRESVELHLGNDGGVQLRAELLWKEEEEKI